MIRIRELDEAVDGKAVDEMERRCDVGPCGDGGGRLTLQVDLLGDPLCRVRHAPDHVMLVAEYGEKGVVVGAVRACIKAVNRGAGPTRQPPTYVRAAYILGLRVSPSHRRLGIGTKLVRAVESWCARKGAEYAYIATDRSNAPSLGLFTRRLAYTPFRSLTILAQPVHSHPLKLPPHSKTTVLQLPPSLAAPLYLKLFAGSEFFPRDIDSLLSHPLTVGTFLAIPSGAHWDPTRLPSSFAITSLWNSKEVLHLRVSGVSKLKRALVKWAWAADKTLPWLNIPSVRNVFKPFGLYLTYGMHMRGELGGELMRCLCRFAHNLAMEDEEIAAVVSEVGGGGGLREAVPHWRRFSCEEDVWCMKRLAAGGHGGGGGGDDWSKSRRSTDDIFVDPREF